MKDELRAMNVDGRRIDDSSPAYVIAEIGSNHQGSVEKAKKLFQAAGDCGANAVKLQKRSNRELFTKALYDSPYDHENSFGTTYGEHREALELGQAEYAELRAYAKELGLDFISTAFDFSSVEFLESIGLDAYKVASGDVKNTPLLRLMAETRKPIILSTGGCSLDDVKRAYATITAIHSQVAILQCTAAYPVEPEDMHLNVITTYRTEFPETVIGLSDHQNGIAMAIVAYALGARVFEKHFTLNRAWKGTDHAFSLEPVGLRKMVRDLSRANGALGDFEKKPLSCEAKPLHKMGKSLVATRPLAAGHVLVRDDLAIKSPAGGLPPYELENILGRTLAKAMQEDECVLFSSVETVVLEVPELMEQLHGGEQPEVEPEDGTRQAPPRSMLNRSNETEKETGRPTN